MFNIEDLEPQAGDLMELTNQEAATVSGGIVIGQQPGTLVALNPQPLPPKSLSGIVIGSIDPGILVGINPQPLPPGILFPDLG